jgi:hypothetical protein
VGKSGIIDREFLDGIAEGRRKKEEGRRKKAEGRRKKEEGRRKKEEPVIARVSAIKNVLTVLAVAIQAPGFIRGINPKSKIENPQAPAFIRGVNLKSKI